ncbi:hypothetical protein Bbelb_064460 [Branchiostoma belcheri]|nr:hypothetical protein Bbelb_064460 [Branchiostoma belcheri]
MADLTKAAAETCLAIASALNWRNWTSLIGGKMISSCKRTNESIPCLRRYNGRYLTRWRISTSSLGDFTASSENCEKRSWGAAEPRLVQNDGPTLLPAFSDIRSMRWTVLVLALLLSVSIGGTNGQVPTEMSKGPLQGSATVAIPHTGTVPNKPVAITLNLAAQNLASLQLRAMQEPAGNRPSSRGTGPNNESVRETPGNRSGANIGVSQGDAVKTIKQTLGNLPKEPEDPVKTTIETPKNRP